MAETFGEANVIIRGDYSMLDQDIRTAEQLVIAQQNRVVQAQQQSARQIIEINREADDGSIVGTAVTAVGAWRLLGLAISGVATAIKAIPIVAAGIGAAITTSVVALVAAITAGVVALNFALSEGSRQIGRFGSDLIGAINAMDGTANSVREVAEQLERIPLVGGLAGAAFRIFSGNAEVADEALFNLVATVEDGEVKLNTMTRLLLGIGQAMEFSATRGGTQFINRYLNAIDDANERTRQFAREIQTLGAVGRETAVVFATLDSVGTSADRAAALQGASDPERVRLMGQFRAEDENGKIDAAIRQARQGLSAEVSRLQTQRDEGEIGSGEFSALRGAAMARFNTALQQAEAQRQSTIETIRQTAEAEAQAAQQNIDAIQRQQQVRSDAAAERMQLEAQAQRQENEGNDFEAQRLRLRAQQQEAIAVAAINGATSDQVDALGQLYAARYRAIETAEAEEKRLIEQEEQEKAQARLQDAEDVRSRIREERLRQGGDDIGADEEAIRRRFQRQIDEAEAAGNAQQAALLRQFRDLQISGLGVEQRRLQVRDVSLAGDRLRASQFGSSSTARVQVQDQDRVVRSLESIDSKIENNSGPMFG